MTKNLHALCHENMWLKQQLAVQQSLSEKSRIWQQQEYQRLIQLLQRTHVELNIYREELQCLETRFGIYSNDIENKLEAVDKRLEHAFAEYKRRIDAERLENVRLALLLNDVLYAKDEKIADWGEVIAMSERDA